MTPSYISESSSSQSQDFHSAIRKFEAERVDENINVLTWWNMKKRDYPVLAIITIII